MSQNIIVLGQILRLLWEENNRCSTTHLTSSDVLGEHSNCEQKGEIYVLKITDKYVMLQCDSCDKSATITIPPLAPVSRSLIVELCPEIPV